MDDKLNDLIRKVMSSKEQIQNLLRRTEKKVVLYAGNEKAGEWVRNYLEETLCIKVASVIIRPELCDDIAIAQQRVPEPIVADLKPYFPVIEEDHVKDSIAHQEMLRKTYNRTQQKYALKYSNRKKK